MKVGWGGVDRGKREATQLPAQDARLHPAQACTDAHQSPTLPTERRLHIRGRKTPQTWRTLKALQQCKAPT